METLLNSLMQENDEIIAIIVSSIKTARNSKQIAIRLPQSEINMIRDKIKTSNKKQNRRQ